MEQNLQTILQQHFFKADDPPGIVKGGKFLLNGTLIRIEDFESEVGPNGAVISQVIKYSRLPQYMSVRGGVTCLDCRWLNSDVIELARGIYQAGPPFASLPILGDALMDAGCDDRQLLTCCQQSEPRALIPILPTIFHQETLRELHFNRSGCYSGHTLKEVVDRIDHWLDDEPARSPLRGMFAELYKAMGEPIVAEAYEWLAAAKKWPDKDGWFAINHGMSRRMSAHCILPIDSRGFLGSRSYNELWDHVETRLRFEQLFVNFWHCCNSTQRRRLWGLIANEHTASSS
jgi:hypothetical protein